MRPRVLAGVARFIPNVNVWQACIDPVLFHIQRCNQWQLVPARRAPLGRTLLEPLVQVVGSAKQNELLLRFVEVLPVVMAEVAVLFGEAAQVKASH